MGNGINTNNPTVVSAFHTALSHQGLVILLILAALAVGWYVLRFLQVHRTAQTGSGPGVQPGWTAPEADARRLLRIGFGLLWILDGILQTQAAMPLGMVPQVVSPAADGSPSWVQHLVNNVSAVWTYHPIVAATATVWIQLGIGIWLLVAPRGVGSRLAGVASVGWGLAVWIFGEAFGAILAPGLSWLTGAPGAVLFYCFAGVLIALPERHWRSPRLGRIVLGLVGAFFVGMALLQAWPGRGYWQGGSGGSLASSVQDMSQTSQPHWLSSWVASFGSFDAGHGWAVNLFAVVALAAIGVAFITAHPRVIRRAVVAATLLCLADWVLVQDLGFLGGVGTDPNSMIPMILVFVAGYLALSPVPAATDAPSTVPATIAGALGDARSPLEPTTIPSALATSDAGSTLAASALSAAMINPAGGPARGPGFWRGAGGTGMRDSARRAVGRWRERLVTDSTYAFHSLAAIGAVAVTLVGVAPMGAAAANRTADPILANAVNGPPEVTNIPTPDFSLVDQHGRTVSLAGLRGKTVALTFLDPLCVHQPHGCPAVQELRLASGSLAAKANRVELVAIDTDPQYLKLADLVSFNRNTGLDRVSNWLYLTGPLPEVRNVLNGFAVHVSPPGAYNMRLMMGLPHGQLAYVIDGSGRTREVLNIGDRGMPVSKEMESSVGVALANAVKGVISK
ncbi:MAG: SCO family protein [Acidimicrobiaceae bacterium]|nr:SCO family protein [Acidimicrobiaceae bacterium]